MLAVLLIMLTEPLGTIVFENLREATHQENSRNMKVKETSDYKGVSDGKAGKFKASICISDECIELGYYSTAKQAAKSYDEAAVKYFKDFAKLNFPEDYKEKGI